VVDGWGFGGGRGWWWRIFYLKDLFMSLIDARSLTPTGRLFKQELVEYK
jgi:hypothetical protein